jgi:O-antigen ligase
VIPILNMARAQLYAGPVQLILPTVLIAALAVGAFVNVRPRLPSSMPALRGDIRPLAWGIALLATVLAGASALASGGQDGLTIALHGIVEPALLGALVVTLRPTRRQLVALGLAIGASVSLASLYSILRVGRMASSLAEAELIRTDLAHFTYYNVGIFGDLLAMALPLLLGALMFRQQLGLPRLATALAGLAGAVSAVAAYLTFSKSAWLGVEAGLFIVAFLAVRGTRLRLGVIVVWLVALTLIVPYPTLVLRAVGIDSSLYSSVVGDIQGGRLSSWDPGTPDGEVSITERILATEAGIRMAVDHPLLGVGPGQFAAEYAGPYHPAAATRDLISAHDLIPELAAEYGFPLALVAILTMLAVLVGLSRVIRGPPGLDRALAVAILASLAGFAIVATTFGVDLYRPYRLMNSDVITAALLLAIGGLVAAGPLTGRASASPHPTVPQP